MTEPILFIPESPPLIEAVDGDRLEQKLNAIKQDIREQYLADSIPWVVAFSGGKDSTATLQLLFSALSKLPRAKRDKEVHVLSNDTLVENPKVIAFLDSQLDKIRVAGKTDLFVHKPELFQVEKSVPKLEDTFWLNVIGKGYPAPNRWFRWCTERLKINPTNAYILDTVSKHGRAIIVLGTRKDESGNRAASMRQYEIHGMRLRKHSLPNAYVFAPIADITNEEVWRYLSDYPNPWNSDNQELIRLYYSAFDIIDCPLVIDKTTPSCGNSRFGCWVCTVVNEDKSMKGMILNGEQWMRPLLDFRDWLRKARDDETKRMTRRRNGSDGTGPFTIDIRKEILERVLRIENQVGYDFITLPELAAIQIQWRYDGFFQHSVAEIYKQIRGKEIMLPSNGVIERRKEEFEILEEVCGEIGVKPDHIKELMQLERERLIFLKRRNLITDMQKKIALFIKDMEPEAA